jgi:hypothetical protein
MGVLYLPASIMYECFCYNALYIAVKLAGEFYFIFFPRKLSPYGGLTKCSKTRGSGFDFLQKQSLSYSQQRADRLKLSQPAIKCLSESSRWDV